MSVVRSFKQLFDGTLTIERQDNVYTVEFSNRFDGDSFVMVFKQLSTLITTLLRQYQEHDADEIFTLEEGLNFPVNLVTDSTASRYVMYWVICEKNNQHFDDSTINFFKKLFIFQMNGSENPFFSIYEHELDDVITFIKQQETELC